MNIGEKWKESQDTRFKMKTYRHYEADYTPNDIGPSEREPSTRDAKEVGDSELETIKEWAELKKDELIYD